MNIIIPCKIAIIFIDSSEVLFGSTFQTLVGKHYHLTTQSDLCIALYLLPPQILPCDEIDTADFRYLNSDFAPNTKYPFHSNVDIEAYNTSWLDDEPIADTQRPILGISDRVPPKNEINTDEDSLDDDESKYLDVEFETADENMPTLADDTERTLTMDSLRLMLAQS